MKTTILKRLYHGFIQLHILHHAKQAPVYGVWMMAELESHGYRVSPGTLYPLLSSMADSGLLKKTEKNVAGKIRKYYTITPLGIEVFTAAGQKAAELFHEIEELAGICRETLDVPALTFGIDRVEGQTRLP
jgi:DNA-binding PadR family transcriptional regulator